LERRDLILLLIGRGIESRLGMVSNACYIHMHVYVYVYVYVYVNYIYIYVYVCIHTHTHTHIKMREDTWLLASEAV